MNLSTNFTLKSLLESATARSMRLGDEQFRPNGRIVSNLSDLVENVLQPTRSAMGAPLNCTSGFRCLTLNRALGSSDKSDHVTGRAADLVVSGSAESRNSFKQFQRAVHKTAENAIGHPLDLRDTNGEFAVFLYLAMRMDDMGIHQLIHEKGKFGNPKWVHVSYHQHDPRGEILVFDGRRMQRGLTINDIFGKVLDAFGE